MNDQQIRAAKNIYAGPTTSAGVRISTSGPLPGTELDWAETKNSTAEVAEFFKYAPDRMIGAHVDSDYLLQHSEDDGSSLRGRTWLSAVKLPVPLDADAP